MTTTLLIAGATAIFAVGVLGLAVTVAAEASGGVSLNPALFKTGNPELHGRAATLGQRGAKVEPGATLEAARKDDGPGT